MISCPYTPQQNGLADRRHRHIVEIAITLLSAAGLSQYYWYHASAHAVFLINRMPCKALHMNSFFFALYDKNPVLNDMRIFGSTIFQYLKHDNDNKL